MFLTAVEIIIIKIIYRFTIRVSEGQTHFSFSYVELRFKISSRLLDNYKRNINLRCIAIKVLAFLEKIIYCLNTIWKTNFLFNVVWMKTVKISDTVTCELTLESTFSIDIHTYTHRCRSNIDSTQTLLPGRLGGGKECPDWGKYRKLENKGKSQGNKINSQYKQ